MLLSLSLCLPNDIYRFRWVSLQLDELRKCADEKDVSDQLGQLPTTLYDTYDRIISKIDARYRGTVHRLMQWLAFSKVPLSLEQVFEVAAIIVEGDKQASFEPAKKWNETTLNEICANLVITEFDDDFRCRLF